jgi:tRNA (cytidine/uridine-2'-O-)-methyltransferase
MFNIVLVEPEIPGNTGNIARTCVVTGSRLHLVEPMGFSIDEKQVRRAGLDYWDKLDLTVYRDLDSFREENKCRGTFWYFSTKAGKVFSEADFKDGDFLVFGKESAGLPEYLVYGNPEHAVRIPMGAELRSLNLANSVAIGLYEALRQAGYPTLH